MVLSRLFAVVLAVAAVAGPRTGLADTVLYEFTSSSCGPCRAMEPVMRELTAAGYAVREVDVAREAALASQYRVVNVPTFIVLVNGQERARWEGGGKSSQQLAEMIRKSEELAGVGSGVALTNNPFGGAAEPGSSAALVPTPGRVVPLQSEPPVAHQTPPREPAAAAAAGAPPAPVGTGGLIAATVRLRIEDPQGNSTGTGTIIDARENKALVLTCGHLFRESAGKGAITLSFFAPGPTGAELRGTAEGTLVAYDLERDLALVCFLADGPVSVAAVAPLGTALEVGAAATSVGCEHGANPTPWATRITAVDRYQGHPNVEAAGAPVEGRSGGGLFNAAGQLIGVCNAADPQGNEGLYASLPSIHAKLDSLGLSFVHQAPSRGGPRPGAVEEPLLAAADSGPAEVAIRGQDPAPTSPPEFPSSFGGAASSAASATPPTAAAASAAPPAMTVEERAALAEIARRGVDSEVICIIRPKAPGGRSEVIKLDRASPAFVQALNGGQASSVR